LHQLPDFTKPLWFILAAVTVYAIVIGRYLTIAGIFHALFYNKSKWQSKKISSKKYTDGQFRQEIIRSNITSIIFAITGALMLIFWQKGYIKVYLNAKAHPWWWLPLSLFIALFIQETYYYWLHRWMHVPSVFKRVHQWHHDSQVASPWTAFSFHPLEGLLQAAFLPLLLLFMPMHLYVLVIMLSIMSVSSVINHLDIEVYPQWFSKHFIGKWLIGATHHALHHKQYKYNYGLYFTCWDVIGNTESPYYNELFEEKSSAPGKQVI
jgi:lathosterol oxidase